MEASGLSELEKGLTDEEMNSLLARWERQGKLNVRTVLTDWETLPDGSAGRRNKMRQYLVGDKILMEHDGRQPYPTPQQFAVLCLTMNVLG